MTKETLKKFINEPCLKSMGIDPLSRLVYFISFCPGTGTYKFQDKKNNIYFVDEVNRRLYKHTEGKKVYIECPLHEEEYKRNAKL